MRSRLDKSVKKASDAKNYAEFRNSDRKLPSYAKIIDFNKGQFLSVSTPCISGKTSFLIFLNSYTKFPS